MMHSGNYATESPFVITPADGLAKFAAITQSDGSNISTAGTPTASDKREFALAASQAKAADATVLVVGMLVLRDTNSPLFGTSCCEGEGNDRPGVAIPQVQLELVDAVATASAAAKKPLVLVVMSG